MTTTHRHAGARAQFTWLALLLAAFLSLATFAPLVATAAEEQKTPDEKTKSAKDGKKGDEQEKSEPAQFDVLYDVGLSPSEKSAHVEIRLGAGSDVVEWIRFNIDPLRYRAIEADGELTQVDEMLQWTPPPEGGSFRYVFSIDHLRDERAYDARCAKSWAIFRGRDLVPQLRIRTELGALSTSTLRLRLPEGWSAALPYRRLTGGRYDLSNPRTRLDRPNGWMAFGELGVLREEFSDTRIAIVGPAGQGVRRMDALALIKWTLPSMREVFGKLPERFQVVIAGDPMWRGGLSGPRSAYLHVDRPLISADATSPLLHEMIHSLMHARAGESGDWIVEGIAEFYSVALLRRSETLSTTRYEGAIEKIRKTAAPATGRLDGEMSSTLRARSVVKLMEIDAMMRSASGGSKSLDDVVRALVASDKSITPLRLQKAMEKVAGRKYDDYFEGLPIAR